MPTAIQPMLASIAEDPFDDPNWLFEIKWDGYRVISFIENGKVRMISRNQNDLGPRYPELRELPKLVDAKSAILDGEVVVLDEHGRPSFSLMQQRTGIRAHGRQAATRPDLPILYYVFDLIYLDGYDLRRVALDDRKRVLRTNSSSRRIGPVLRPSCRSRRGLVPGRKTKRARRHRCEEM